MKVFKILAIGQGGHSRLHGKVVTQQKRIEAKSEFQSILENEMEKIKNDSIKGRKRDTDSFIS